MIELSCLCGTVRLETAKRPDFMNECNCALCSKSGARWGYFHPSEVTVEGATGSYSRTDKPDPAAVLHFCPTCGSTTHFTLTESGVAKHGDGIMGVNMLLADERELAGLEVRFPDGRNWEGAGEIVYVRAAWIIGDGAGSG